MSFKKEEIIGTYIMKTNSQHTIWQFKSDQKAIENNQEMGVWGIEEDKIIINYHNKSYGDAKIWRENDQFVGVNKHLDGKIFNWKLDKFDKKIAFLISGHMRTFTECARTLNMFPPGDFYISTWNMLGFSDWKEMNQMDKRLEGPVKEIEIRNHYHNCVLKIESQKYFDRMNLVNNYSGIKNYNYAAYKNQNSMMIKTDRIISQWYKIADAWSLLKGNYDIVIRTRPDISFSHVDVYKLYQIEDGIVYMPLIERWPPDGGCNDQFAVGTTNTMSVYCSLYDKIDKYLAKNIDPRICAEFLLKEHIKSMNLKEGDIDVKYILKRNIVGRKYKV